VDLAHIKSDFSFETTRFFVTPFHKVRDKNRMVLDFENYANGKRAKGLIFTRRDVVTAKGRTFQNTFKSLHVNVES